MTGETIATLARIPSEQRSLPEGVSSMPGPALLLATNVTDSAFGHYLELMIGESARIGAKVGWCITKVIVNKVEVELALRSGWGFPARQGRLSWRDRDGNPELCWLDREISVEAVCHGPAVPSYFPLTALQRAAGESRAAAGRIIGRGRVASARVHVLPGDDLGHLSGAHPALVIRGARFVLGPAKEPRFLPRLARASAPEPAMWMRGRSPDDVLA